MFSEAYQRFMLRCSLIETAVALSWSLLRPALLRSGVNKPFGTTHEMIEPVSTLRRGRCNHFTVKQGFWLRNSSECCLLDL